MNIRSVRRLLATAIPALALVGVFISAPDATQTIISATSTHVCASGASWCPHVIASVPGRAQLEVICSGINSYYIDDLANRALEGYVAKSDVRNAPGGLTDCDSTAHPAIYAAANALGDMDTDDYAGHSLEFAQHVWAEAGKSIPDLTQGGSGTAQDWWYEYYGTLGYAWDTAGARFKTPPRGALVFWDGDNNYPQYDSEAGQVAISLGNGRLVSPGEGRTPYEVHLLTISERNAQPGVGAYLGWVMPIPGYHIQQ